MLLMRAALGFRDAMSLQNARFVRYTLDYMIKTPPYAAASMTMITMHAVILMSRMAYQVKTLYGRY